MENIPAIPPHSFRVTLNQTSPGERLDAVLMEGLRAQDQNQKLKAISRAQFKVLFAEKKIQIKGQNAKPSSTLAKGTTYVDILGYESDSK